MVHDLLLKGATVVDVRRGTLLPNAAVMIRNGIIAEVSTVADPARSAEVPRSITTVSVAGQFLVPGFNDMHAHALQDSHPEDTLRVMLAYGITGIRQLAGSSALLEARRKGVFAAMPDTPEVLEIAGELLTRRNAPTPEAAVAEVKRQVAEGADFIKVIDVDNPTFFAALAEAHRQQRPFLGHVPVVVDVAEASRKGMRSVEHLGPAEVELISCSKREWLVRFLLKRKPPTGPDLSPESMAKIGKMIIANPVLFRATVDKESFTKVRRLVDSFSERKCRSLAKTFVENNTWQAPTLIRLATMQFADDPQYTESTEVRYVAASVRKYWATLGEQYRNVLTNAARDTMHRLMELELRMVKIFDQEGVKMLTGSDYGGGWVMPGASLHQEFALCAQAGLSPVKVLQMTTSLPAEFLGREAKMGAVEPGVDANLVLLAANPLEAVCNLQAIRGVVRAGKFYSSDQLEAIKEEVAARAASR